MRSSGEKPITEKPYIYRWPWGGEMERRTDDCRLSAAFPKGSAVFLSWVFSVMGDSTPSFLCGG